MATGALTQPVVITSIERLFEKREPTSVDIVELRSLQCDCHT